MVMSRRRRRRPGVGGSEEVELQKWDLRTMKTNSYTRHCNGNFGPEPREAVKWSVSRLKRKLDGKVSIPKDKQETFQKNPNFLKNRTLNPDSKKVNPDSKKVNPALRK